MAKRKPAQRRRSGDKLHLFGTALTLAIGLSLHSCADIPAEREVLAAGAGVKALIKELGTAVREQAARTGQPGTAPKPDPTAAARTDGATQSFSACRQFFAAGKPPMVPQRPTHRALCYDAFAILHFGESKTAVYVAQKLNRALVADADEKRADKFFADARLRAAERATLEDYRRSGFDRGHLQYPAKVVLKANFTFWAA